MYCKYCGSEIDENAAVCMHCGRIVAEAAPAASSSDDNELAIIGFALSFVFPVVGLILSIVAFRRVSQGGNHRSLAIAGIVVSSVEVGISILAILSMVGFYGLMLLPLIFGSAGMV